MQPYVECNEIAKATVHTCDGIMNPNSARTLRSDSRGSLVQSCYLGSQMNCLIYRTSLSFDDLPFNSDGPNYGRGCELTSYRKGGSESVMQNYLVVEKEDIMVYAILVKFTSGKLAYLLRRWTQQTFRGVLITLQKLIFNFSMGTVRDLIKIVFEDGEHFWKNESFPCKLKLIQVSPALF